MHRENSWDCTSCKEQGKQGLRNCNGLSNPDFKVELKTGIDLRDREIVNVCPIKLIPPEFARFNLYVLMAKTYRLSPHEVDQLSQRHITYFLAGMESESLIQKIMMREAENRQNLKGKKGKQKRK